MKILLVAPQSPDTTLGAIGGYCKKAMESLGYDFEIFDFRKTWYLKNRVGNFLKKILKKFPPALFSDSSLFYNLDRDRMNRLLLTKIKVYQPDALLILMGDTISPFTLTEAKKEGAIIINWFHDTLLATIRKNFVQEISPYYDYFFMVDSEDILNRVRVGSRFVKTIPLACDLSIHKEINLTQGEKNQYGSDVCFVGSVNRERKEILSQLSDFNLSIWGNWEEEIPALRDCYRKKYIYGEEAVKIYNASKIIIDLPLLHSGNKDIFYVTLRVFEVPACGAFLLTKQCAYISELYEVGKEIVCYKNTEELSDLIKYYLKHEDERGRIAKRGQEKAHKYYTYTKRIEEIFSIVQRNG